VLEGLAVAATAFFLIVFARSTDIESKRRIQPAFLQGDENERH
jgi:hypothetical protein